MERWAAVSGDEAANEEALYGFLNHALGRTAVVYKQYSFAKTRADLFVEFKDGGRVAVEVKANLTDRNEYHRLIGQIYAYLIEWKCHVVLVLCGECDPALVKLTHDAVDHFNFACDPKLRLLVRPYLMRGAA